MWFSNLLPHLHPVTRASGLSYSGFYEKLRDTLFLREAQAPPIPAMRTSDSCHN